jgi:hypothetical protein
MKSPERKVRMKWGDGSRHCYEADGPAWSCSNFSRARRTFSLSAADSGSRGSMMRYLCLRKKDRSRVGKVLTDVGICDYYHDVHIRRQDLE